MPPVKLTFLSGLLLALLPLAGRAALAGEGNRLAYLDGQPDPYWVGLGTARLTTPQWVGEPGVDAVIVLSIDDLRDTAKHENYLRPIFQRLKQIDGRAPVSLMANRIDRADPQLQRWLAEGASLEAHTWDHPCPCLQGGKLAVAKQTYDRSVDAMAAIPGNRAVAYRMPCCDSMSSVSPRFFAEIFNRTTPEGRFLSVDASVFMVLSAADPSLPRPLVLEAGGRERFRKYIPTDRVMANWIENYPYPYVIGNLCWEIPTLMPSDWDAQHLNGVYSAATVADLKAAVDATVVKQGMFALCFHPHGWIRNDQIVELIDYAAAKHGKRVKFLTLREVYDRLTENFLGGQPLRTSHGHDNGVRVLDVDYDGYMDAVVGNPSARQTRVWQPESQTWSVDGFPAAIVAADRAGGPRDPAVQFGILEEDGHASFIGRGADASVYHFDGRQWAPRLAGPTVPSSLPGKPAAAPDAADADPQASVRRYLRDLDGDGVCEILECSDRVRIRRWPSLEVLPFVLPQGTRFHDDNGHDAGLRLVDLDEDGRLDVVFSDAERFSIHLFTSIRDGWSREVVSGRHGGAADIPPIVRADGTDNGVWFKHRQMWAQNEDTGGVLPGHVWQRSFRQLLDGDREAPPR